MLWPLALVNCGRQRLQLALLLALKMLWPFVMMNFVRERLQITLLWALKCCGLLPQQTVAVQRGPYKWFLFFLHMGILVDPLFDLRKRRSTRSLIKVLIEECFQVITVVGRINPLPPCPPPQIRAIHSMSSAASMTRDLPCIILCDEQFWPGMAMSTLVQNCHNLNVHRRS